MTDNHDIYNKLPNEILDRDEEYAKKYVYNLIGSVAPGLDLNPNVEENIFSISNRRKSNFMHTRSDRQKKSYITRKEKKKLNLLKCPKTGWNYEEFKSLRNIWNQYMQTYLNAHKSTKKDIEQYNWGKFNNKLSKADYHGAEMEVIRALNPSLVGISGTCILDTKNTFKILSKDNKCRTVSKSDCVFKIPCNNIILTVYGKYIKIRPADRSSKKIKANMIPDL